MKRVQTKKEKKSFICAYLKSQKKADISSKTVVTVILLVIGFVLVLIVYNVIDWKGQSNKEICHNSVVLRGTLPDALGIQEIVPLRCETEKVCIRGSKFFGKGECNEFKNVKDVTYVDVNKLEDVEKTISDQIVDCWNMMGQGELSLFSHGWLTSFGFGEVYSSCTICSRIAFDKKTLDEKGIDLSKRDILNYMRTHKIPDGNESYYEYLLKGKAAVSDTSKRIDKIEIKSNKTNESVSLNLSDVIQVKPDNGTEQLAILFMQISAPSRGEVISNSIGALVGSGAFVAPVGGVKLTRGAISTICKNPYTCAALAIVATGTIVAQQWNVGNNMDIAATHCGDVFVGDNINYGCSVVRTVNYNIDDIKQYCGVIESIP